MFFYLQHRCPHSDIVLWLFNNRHIVDQYMHLSYSDGKELELEDFVPKLDAVKLAVQLHKKEAEIGELNKEDKQRHGLHNKLLWCIPFVPAPSPSTPDVLLNFCVFCTALLGPFCAETACGASAALRAFVPAPKAQDAQIQLPVLL
jgi:hypothetical protein